MNDVVVEVDRYELLQAIRRDCVTFLAFYLQDELTLEVPEFHIEIWNEFLEILENVNRPDFIVGQLKKLFCVPREHAKSTLSKLAVVLFLRYSKFKFALYASNTKNVALMACQSIKGFFDSAQDIELYGPRPTAETANKSEGLWVFSIPVPGKKELKRVFLKAIGAETQVRGTLVENSRPEIVVIDDCEDLNTASTEVTQARLDEWMLGSLLKSVAKCSVVFMLGNMIRETTLIARLSKDPKWNPTVFGSIVRDRVTRTLKPLWAGRHTLEGLIEEYKTYRRLGRGQVWAHEMMNLTSESVFGIELDKAVMIPQPNPDQIRAGCIMLDPAFGLKAYNDESALTVHVQLADENMYGYGIPHVVETWKGRVTEEQLLDELLRLSFYWGINTWAIETNTGQKLFIPFFRTALLLRGFNPDAIAMLSISGSNEAKNARILTWRNSVTYGSYGIAESCGDLIDKMLSYDPSSIEHDDLVDSAALGAVAWAYQGDLIEARGVSNIAMALMNTEIENQGLDELAFAPM